MADGVKRKRDEMTAEQVAQRLLRDLSPRFVRLNKATGIDDEESGEWFITVSAPKLSCEAKFKPGTSYERIRNSVSAWAEQHARKLGVTKIYANARDEDEAA